MTKGPWYWSNMSHVVSFAFLSLFHIETRGMSEKYYVFRSASKWFNVSSKFFELLLLSFHQNTYFPISFLSQTLFGNRDINNACAKAKKENSLFSLSNICQFSDCKWINNGNIYNSFRFRLNDSWFSFQKIKLIQCIHMWFQEEKIYEKRKNSNETGVDFSSKSFERSHIRLQLFMQNFRSCNHFALIVSLKLISCV